MKQCYTIGSINNISNDFYTAQFTENSRINLTSRRSAETIRKLRAKGVKTNIIVHQDFIYIASRYIMFNDRVKRSILDYLKSYNGTDVVGIVMHTDYPIKQEVFKHADTLKAISDSYKYGVWNESAILDAYKRGNIVEESIIAFANDIVNEGITTRIYLENTTSIGRDSEGSNGVSTIQYLINLFHKYPELHNVFGIAYDTCHQYAVDGVWLSVDEVVNIHKTLCPVIVHLNTIPQEVTPGSRRDRHSLTTIYECSVNTSDYYEAYADALDKAGILWVREVKQETMERELNGTGSNN